MIQSLWVEVLLSWATWRKMDTTPLFLATCFIQVGPSHKAILVTPFYLILFCCFYFTYTPQVPIWSPLRWFWTTRQMLPPLIPMSWNFIYNKTHGTRRTCPLWPHWVQCQSTLLSSTLGLVVSLWILSFFFIPTLYSDKLVLYYKNISLN